jgi:predicted transcriptional regulator
MIKELSRGEKIRRRKEGKEPSLMQEYCPEAYKKLEYWKRFNKQYYKTHYIKSRSPYDFTRRKEFYNIIYDILEFIVKDGGRSVMNRIVLNLGLGNYQKNYYFGIMVKSGLVNIHERFVKKRKRVHYSITDKGVIFMYKYQKLKEMFTYDGLNLFGEGGKMTWSLDRDES